MSWFLNKTEAVTPALELEIKKLVIFSIIEWLVGMGAHPTRLPVASTPSIGYQLQSEYQLST